ncbi:MAG: NAD-dependent epimerase/dehydratase family protein [Verrucomicrobiota bacterium]
MHTILITGSSGFVGRSLCVELARQDNVQLLRHDLDNTRDDLHAALARVDVIYHLAGVNRPHDPAEFEMGNAGLTHELCRFLIETGRAPKIILSSSTQAALDNPYGVSKRHAEEVVHAYAAATGAEVVIYRLPNVFGKGCRPNYNSAVATFCHNIARDLPIQVSDPTREMELVYIDDLIEALVADQEKPGPHHDSCTPEDRGAASQITPLRAPTYRITLGRIVELLQSFRRSRTDLHVPDQADAISKKLYATYLSYLPTDQFSYSLTMHVDARGSFTEFLKTSELGQVSINISKPHITKGNHWHHTKNEKFLVVSGSGVIRLRRSGEREEFSGKEGENHGKDIIEHHVSGENLVVVDIPPGYTHNIENLGDTDMVTVMWANEAFDPARPDTVFENV